VGNFASERAFCPLVLPIFLLMRQDLSGKKRFSSPPLPSFFWQQSRTSKLQRDPIREIVLPHPPTPHGEVFQRVKYRRTPFALAVPPPTFVQIPSKLLFCCFFSYIYRPRFVPVADGNVFLGTIFLNFLYPPFANPVVWALQPLFQSISKVFPVAFCDFFFPRTKLIHPPSRDFI